MTDRPIIFSGPMVRALLAGRKTQTRRLATSPLRRVEVGDRLYVRETWAVTSIYDGMKAREINPSGQPEYSGIRYAANHSRIGIKDRPSIHMPRWASRLTLIVEDVRLQRLDDISECDARAEGFPITWDGKPYDPPSPDVDSWQGYGRASMCLYWSQLHGPGSWQANPEIVALTFSVHHGNIDMLHTTPERTA